MSTDSSEQTEAGRRGSGARGRLTFQGQAGIPWESQAENIITGTDLREFHDVLLLTGCVTSDKLLNLSELVSSSVIWE